MGHRRRRAVRAKFTCAQCGGTFDKAWTDEEAEAEGVAAFGSMPGDAVIVCDDCYEPIMVANR